MTMLTNKTFLVAGANGLLGTKITIALLDAGANVVATDVELSALESMDIDSAMGSRLITLQADIQDSDSICNAIDQATGHFGPLDGAVNSAYPRNKHYGRHFFDVTFDDFSDNLSGHLGGYFIFMQQCAKYATNEGREFSLVNFSSVYGVMAPRFSIYQGTEMTMPVEYAAIKSAIQHLTRYVTAYTKGTEFRVNCISPGGIADGQNPEFIKGYQAHSNTKGMLDASDILGTVLFLCSDASRYIRGQNIIVDDGFST
jgi:NAD(P)-dependent dehydrogenase (short-subunit alcohol dehydrogenase family)